MPRIVLPPRLAGRAVLRDPDEEHRASTPLELFFDLVFVVAVGRAAAGLHHELVEDHIRDGIVGFMGMFFGAWWAWMNYTWFSSAHDSNDVAHRLLTFVQMSGALIFAAGATSAIEDRQFLVATVGYVIMRCGLIASWLRVARDRPEVRNRALRYATGVAVVQVLWVLRLALPESWLFITFAVLVIAEMCVPLWAEHTTNVMAFHPEHIEERYGLFTIIVLGECVLAATSGFQTAFDEAGLTADLLTIGLSGLVLAFSAWWLYFDHPGHLAPTDDVSFRWGYAHVLLFGSIAAMGAGIAVAADVSIGHGDERVASLAVAIPVAGFLIGLATVMQITGRPIYHLTVFPKLLAAGLALISGLALPMAAAIGGCAVVLGGLALWMVMSDPPPRIAVDPPAEDVQGV